MSEQLDLRVLAEKIQLALNDKGFGEVKFELDPAEYAAGTDYLIIWHDQQVVVVESDGAGYIGVSLLSGEHVFRSAPDYICQNEKEAEEKVLQLLAGTAVVV